MISPDTNPPKRSFLSGLKKGFFLENTYEYTGEQVKPSERAGAMLGNVVAIVSVSQAPKVIVGAKELIFKSRFVTTYTAKVPKVIRYTADMFITPIAAATGTALVGKEKEKIKIQSQFRTDEERKQFAMMVSTAQEASRKKGKLSGFAYEVSGGFLGSDKKLFEKSLRTQIIDMGVDKERQKQLMDLGRSVRGVRGRTEIYAILASGGASEIKGIMGIKEGFK